MVCEYCNEEHNGIYGSGRFCNVKCARGFATKAKRKEINKEVSAKLKGCSYGYKFPKGKNNPKFKEFGKWDNNKINSNKIFDKFKGVCQDCEKILDKEKDLWDAHHNQLLLTKEEYIETLDRTLLCRSCHTTWHNINYPKKHNYGILRII